MSVEVLRVWEVCDKYLRYMLEECFVPLRDAVAGRDVSAVWSKAAERSLVEAVCASSGPVLVQGFVKGRSVARFKEGLKLGRQGLVRSVLARWVLWIRIVAPLLLLSLVCNVG